MAELSANQYETRALELAWRSCRTGTVGVGALLVDADGTILAEGNNAIFAAADAGPLSGSRVAHAEMNVFAQISGEVRPQEATLYTSLEPCAMCAGAIINHNIKAVHILTQDPLMHSLDAIGDRNEWVRDRWAPRTWASDPNVGRLATLFAGHNYFSVFDATHPYVSSVLAAKPNESAWMTSVIADGTVAELIEGQASLSQVIEAVL